MENFPEYPAILSNEKEERAWRALQNPGLLWDIVGALPQPLRATACTLIMDNSELCQAILDMAATTVTQLQPGTVCFTPSEVTTENDSVKAICDMVDTLETLENRPV